MKKINNKQDVQLSRFVAFFVIGIIFFLTYQIIKPFLGIIASAIIFTIFLNPLYLRLKTVSQKPKLSAFVTVLSLLFFIIAPLGLFASKLFSEVLAVTRSIQNNPELINSFQITLDNYIQSLQLPPLFEGISLNEQAYQLLSFIALNLGSIVLRSGGVLLNLFFVLMTMYFLLINQRKIIAYFDDLSIFEIRYRKRISTRISEIVNGTVRGYLLVVVLQLIVGIVGFTLFDTYSAVLLGSLYGFSSLLPIVGGFLLWVPVVILHLIAGNTMTALLITIWFLLLSFLIENVITPKIIGENTKLHQLFIMFSVFGGIQYFGLLGLILGPVVIALSFIALSILKEFVKKS